MRSAIKLGECGALWGKREQVVSCIYESMVVTYICNAQCTIGYLYSIGSLGRAPSPISASLIFPAFARLFLPHVGLYLSFSCAQ